MCQGRKAPTTSQSINQLTNYHIHSRHNTNTISYVQENHTWNWISIITNQIKNFCSLLFYIIETSMVISGRVLTYDNSWLVCSAAALGNAVVSAMTWYPAQSHISWHCANHSLPYHNNAEHMARKWQVTISSVNGFTQPGFEHIISRTRGPCFTDSATEIKG